ncbi:MAG: hypothetical protein ABGY96_10000 [bacterium]
MIWFPQTGALYNISAFEYQYLISGTDEDRTNIRAEAGTLFLV